MKMSKTADNQAIADDETAEELESSTTVIDDADNHVDETESNNNDTDQDSEAEHDDVVVTIGEEAPPTTEDNHAPEWVRELRKTNREDKRRIRELEERLHATKTVETKPAVLGKKPALEDYDYDTENYEQALTEWFEQKRESEQVAMQAEIAQKEQQKAWQAKLDAYGAAKTALKVRDFDDAEAVAQDVFNITQQGIVLQGAENPALIIYALGKNPKKAREISTITDPVKFAFAVAKLETQLKVTQRKAATAPERTVQGTGGKSGTVDSTLERLRAEAAKSGDYTKVTQYKKSKQVAK
jgi:hypothetical protein